MSLNASTVEEAALEWFLLRQGYGGQVGDPPSPRLRWTGLGHPPDLQEEAVRTVLAQPELLCADWAA